MKWNAPGFKLLLYLVKFNQARHSLRQCIEYFKHAPVLDQSSVELMTKRMAALSATSRWEQVPAKVMRCVQYDLYV